MSGKAFIVIVVLAACAVAGVAGTIDRDPAAGTGITGAGAPRSYSATVDVDSIRVISYVDDQGVEHAPDSTFVAPVPIQGLRDFTVVVGRPPFGPVSVAGRVDPR